MGLSGVENDSNEAKSKCDLKLVVMIELFERSLSLKLPNLLTAACYYFIDIVVDLRGTRVVNAAMIHLITDLMKDSYVFQYNLKEKIKEYTARSRKQN